MSLEIREKYLNDSKNNPEIPNESIIETQKIIIYLNEYEKHKAQEFFGKTYEELQKIDGDKNRKISSKFYFYE